MATVASRTNAASTERGFIHALLQNGDHLSVREFERRYAAMPPEIKAELIEGVVHVASPVSNDHGAAHFRATTWLGVYQSFTPLVASSLDGTLRLDSRNEPQPDIHMRILPEYGGRATVDADDYVAGAPELICEVARSSVSRDLHDKLEAYRRNQVREYLVWRTVDDRSGSDWFELRESRFVRLEPDADGLYKSEVFPGLWLDEAALIRGDIAALIRAVQAGVSTPAHAAFVKTTKATPQQGTEAP